jgi:hypothetical protein
MAFFVASVTSGASATEVAESTSVFISSAAFPFLHEKEKVSIKDNRIIIRVIIKFLKNTVFFEVVFTIPPLNSRF